MRKKKKNRKLPGSPPGSLVFTGEKKVASPYLMYVQYDADSMTAADISGRPLPDIDTQKMNWLDLRGIHDVSLVEAMGHKYNLHPLVVEDVLNPHQRPKMEEYENGLFFVMQWLSLRDGVNFEIGTEQIGIFVAENVVLTFQEIEDDTFAQVRERIANGRGRVRKAGPDYLAYTMIDGVVDNYFIILDHLEDQIEALENEILLKQASQEAKSKIHSLKRETIILRKSISPLREAIAHFARTGFPIVSDESRLFLRDLADHTLQLMDLLETHRDVLNGLYDLYLSEISYRMNNIMQVLTVISTIFIPLTFLAGVYGMNFDNLPELHWHYGYFYLWGFMILLSLLMLRYFRRKHWL
jgi:magnesium transporter